MDEGRENRKEQHGLQAHGRPTPTPYYSLFLSLPLSYSLLLSPARSLLLLPSPPYYLGARHLRLQPSQPLFQRHLVLHTQAIASAPTNHWRITCRACSLAPACICARARSLAANSVCAQLLLRHPPPPTSPPTLPPTLPPTSRRARHLTDKPHKPHKPQRTHKPPHAACHTPNASPPAGHRRPAGGARGR